MKSLSFPAFSLFLFFSSKAQLNYTVVVPDSTHTVFIAGAMTGWYPVEMQNKSNNLYSIEIPNATPLHAYKYLSGPAWDYAELKFNGTPLRNRDYSPKDTVERWQLTWNFRNNFPPSVEQGRIERTWFRSALVDDRYIDVWLPPNYNSDKKYNVLYMHDGQMLFHAATWNGQEWNVDSTLAILAAKGSIQKTIVIGIHNNGQKRHAEYFPQKVIDQIPAKEKSVLINLFRAGTGSDDYLKFIVHELKPFIDSNYSTHSGQQHTYIAGSSMGGLVSLYAFCEYPEVFSRAACLSTHWTGTFKGNDAIPNAINQYLEAHLPSPIGRRLYFDYGTSGLDSLYRKHQLKIDKTVRAKKYKSSHYKTLRFIAADHNENAWRKRFSIPARFILSGGWFK